MTDSEMNIAICELRGWLRMMRNSMEVYYDPEGGHVLPHELPNHINGIEALGHMHAAEEMLTAEESEAYMRAIQDITFEKDGDWGYCHATAKRRAEALLRTLGVLKEAQPCGVSDTARLDKLERYLSDPAKMLAGPENGSRGWEFGYNGGSAYVIEGVGKTLREAIDSLQSPTKEAQP